MICEQCKAEGKTSTVIEGMNSTTAAGYTPYYDEGGKYHYHNPNVTIYAYRCSNGHEFSKYERDVCWCGWPDKEQGK